MWPGGEDRLDLNRARVDDLAVAEELVELAAVRREAGRKVKDALEHLLHVGDPLANGHGRVGEELLEELRARQMVGVSVRLEDVTQVELLVLEEARDPLDVLGPHLRAARLVVEDRVDHDRVPALGVEDDVGEREGAIVVEGFDFHDLLHADAGRCPFSFTLGSNADRVPTLIREFRHSAAVPKPRKSGDFARFSGRGTAASGGRVASRCDTLRRMRVPWVHATSRTLGTR